MAQLVYRLSIQLYAKDQERIERESKRQGKTPHGYCVAAIRERLDRDEEESSATPDSG